MNIDDFTNEKYNTTNAVLGPITIDADTASADKDAEIAMKKNNCIASISVMERGLVSVLGNQRDCFLSEGSLCEGRKCG